MSSRPQLKWFGTSGIRGRTLKDITPAMAEKMARAYAQVVISGITRPFVVIGHDTRYGAETIELALISGLTAAGISVIRCGIIPSPVLLTYLKHMRADGAIIVTGSHIPQDRIGIIFIESDGSYCSDFIAYQIEQNYDSIKETDGLIDANSIGDLIEIGWIRSAPDVWDVYRDILQASFDLPLLQRNPFRIVVDPGNGTASHFFSQYLGSTIGLDVTTINDYPAPLSSRLPEPIDANLDRLKFLVGNTTDLGIAFDVDADRITFVAPTPTGPQTVPADQLGALLLDDLFSGGYTGDVILPINTSNLVEEILAKYNNKPRYCRIGQPGTIEMAKKCPKPLFAFEESGKYYFLKDGYLWTDGMLTSLRVLELMARKNMSLYNLLKALPTYATYRTDITIKDNLMPKVNTTFRKYLSTIPFANEKERLTIDGTRINFTDNSFLLLRVSGTEPKIRIVSDAKQPSRAKDLLLSGEKIVKEFLGQLG